MSRADARARLVARREALLQRSAQLRERLALRGQTLQPALQWAERVRSGWHWLHAHPWVPVISAFVVAAYRPRRAWALLLLAWRGWRRWRWLSSWLTHYGRNRAGRISGRLV